MPRESTVYEVLIASPSDVHRERTVLIEVIEDWNSANSRSRGTSLQRLRWELDSLPESGGRPQEIINKQLVEKADILMAVFWSRLGTPTGDAISGTVEEIERFRDKEKHVLLYFSEADVPRNHDADQLRCLREYQRAVEIHTLYDTFRDAEDLRRRATRHLARLMNEVAPGAGAAPRVEARGEGSPLARLVFQTQPQQTIPGSSVRPVRVFAAIENLSNTKRIREYSVTLSVPKCCLSFQNSMYVSEIESQEPNYRRFRHTERNQRGAPIHPGDRFQIISIDIAVGHLAPEQLRECLKMELIGEAVADGETLGARKTIAELTGGQS